jgi:hypothetical protein
MTDRPADADFETVYVTDDLTLLAIVKSVLESAEIPHLVQGEGALGLIPLSGPMFGLARPPFQARVRVPGEHAAAAREVLRGEGEGEETAR